MEEETDTNCTKKFELENPESKNIITHEPVITEHEEGKCLIIPFPNNEDIKNLLEQGSDGTYIEESQEDVAKEIDEAHNTQKAIYMKRAKPKINIDYLDSVASFSDPIIPINEDKENTTKNQGNGVDKTIELEGDRNPEKEGEGQQRSDLCGKQEVPPFPVLPEKPADEKIPPEAVLDRSSLGIKTILTPPEKPADEKIPPEAVLDRSSLGINWCRPQTGRNQILAISVFLVGMKFMISLANAVPFNRCEAQQPVNNFSILINDSICRYPKSNHPVCEDGFFICAVFINRSLGAGCVKDFCIRDGYCPMFTHRELANGEKGFVIQDGRLCLSCNGSYIIPNWEKYPECYTVTLTTTRTPTMTGTFTTTLAPTTTKTSTATKMPNATGSISNETVTTQKMSSDLILGLKIGGGILALIVVIIVIILVLLKRNTERGQHYNRYLPSCLRSHYQRPERPDTVMQDYNSGHQ